MANDYTIGVGTVGAGMWFSYNSGEKWRHIYKRVNPEGNVRALRVCPGDPHRVYAVSDYTGVMVSEDNGYIWEHVPSPITDSEIWSIEVDPVDPDRIYVGARPGAFRSTDRGETWERMDTGLGDECPIGVPRITNLVVDPRDHTTVWCGVEVDGIYKSTDGGDTWSHLADIGPSPFHGDIHGLAVRPYGSNGSADLLAGTPYGLGTSSDEGQSWDWHEFGGFDKGSGNEYAYCRGVFVMPDDPDTVMVGVGDYIPGMVGAIEISRDGGASWTRADLPTEPNSTMYWMATHAECPGVVVAASVFGQVYVSEDTGEQWRQLPREFGEIRAVSLAPC